MILNHKWPHLKSPNCAGSNTEYDIPQENIWSETANCSTTDNKAEEDFEDEEEDINNDAARSERFVIVEKKLSCRLKISQSYISALFTSPPPGSGAATRWITRTWCWRPR